METSNPSSSARLLIRPPSSSASSAAPLPAPSSSPLASPDLPTPPPPPKSSPSVPSRAPPPSSQARPPDGVVVVGFVGRRPDDVTPLINRVLDTNAFGSGNLDQSLCIEKEEFRDWFGNRRISYYHEEERGILYLQYCSRQCPAMGTVSDSQLNFDAVLEERDFGDLQGFLFMFSVTPPFPVVLATCPAIQFEASCLPSFIPDCDRLVQFSLGSQVILPPESFLTLRLPFVYGVQLDNGCLHPLRPLEHQPELTAWIKKGTTLQVLSREAMLVGDSQCG